MLYRILLYAVFVGFSPAFLGCNQSRTASVTHLSFEQPETIYVSFPIENIPSDSFVFIWWHEDATSSVQHIFDGLIGPGTVTLKLGFMINSGSLVKIFSGPAGIQNVTEPREKIKLEGISVNAYSSSIRASHHSLQLARLHQYKGPDVIIGLLILDARNDDGHGKLKWDSSLNTVLFQ
jgi:hypothetical protein